MKLSQIKGDRAYDVLAEIVEPIATIMFDEESRKALSGIGDKDKTKDAIKILPKIMKKHKPELMKVLSALDGVSVAEYTKELTLAKITNDFVDLMYDEESQKLFTNAEQEKENK